MFKKILWLGLPSAFLVGLVGWRMITKEKVAQELKVDSKSGAKAPLVESMIVGPGTLEGSLVAVGSLESPFRVQLSPVTSGRIDYLQVREGDAVSPGQVLVRTDASDADAQIAQYRATVAEAKSRLAQAQLGENATTTTVTSQLEQQQAGLTSAVANANQVKRNLESQIASAEAQVKDATARLASAESVVLSASANLERDKVNLVNLEQKRDRAKSLLDKGFVPTQAYDDARTLCSIGEAAVEVSKSQVVVAKRAVDSVRAQKESAEQNVAIVRRKGQADITASEATSAQSQAGVRTAKANRVQTPAYKENLSALRSAVSAAEAQLSQAVARRANTELKSPISGYVTSRNFDPGALASPGQPVLVIQFLDWLYLLASLPIEASDKVELGQEATVKIDALPNRKITGTIIGLNPSADAVSRQFGIRLRIENKDHTLRPGMFGTISLSTNRIQASVVVPKEAIKSSDVGVRIQVLSEDLKVEVRTVKIGATDGVRVQVTEGLKPGEQIVTRAYQSLKDGQVVRLARK